MNLKDQITELKCSGLSFQQIAHRLGLTRGAVAGRVRRLSLDTPQPDKKPRTRHVGPNTVLAHGGHPDSEFIETWEQRKIRRAQERMRASG